MWIINAGVCAIYPTFKLYEQGKQSVCLLYKNMM